MAEIPGGAAFRTANLDVDEGPALPHPQEMGWAAPRLTWLRSVADEAWPVNIIKMPLRAGAHESDRLMACSSPNLRRMRRRTLWTARDRGISEAVEDVMLFTERPGRKRLCLVDRNSIGHAQLRIAGKTDDAGAIEQAM